MGATGIFLSYKGLGTNILHLSYCHEIAKRDGGNYKKLNDDFDQHSKDLEKQGENKKLTNLLRSFLLISLLLYLDLYLLFFLFKILNIS